MDPATEAVSLWMTAHPDVLSPDEKVDAAWASLTAHHYRHLPVVEGGQLVGVVSLRDLMGVARIRPAAETSGDVPAGLEGVVVAETTVGDVRGQEGFFHYRQYSAVDLAERRSLEDVWHLLFVGELPDAAASRCLRRRCAGAASCRPGWPRCCRRWRAGARPSMCCAPPSRCSGAELGWRPTHDIERRGALRPGPRAVRGGAHHPGRGPPAAAGLEPVEPRDDLGFAANYLYMLTGSDAEPASTPGPSSST